jgi:7,8-dihydropterin-6-yl-methyl-4-(beta-D-ribofuranosyl)aminobenzene 5'-phosphate synthase
MIITTLVENYTYNDNLKSRHGFALLIQLDNGPTVLFDTGPDDAILFNMAALKLSPEEIDFIVVSHGHQDHGGGLKSVLENNSKAKVYLHEKCQDKFFVERHNVMRPISFYDESLPGERIDFVNKDKNIHPQLQIFTGFDHSGFYPSGNKNLYVQKNNDIVPDDFDHEIALLVREKYNNLLITGCSHSGVGNIIKDVLKRSGLEQIEHVVGGFHLKPEKNIKKIQPLADELNQFPGTIFHTGHCTGKEQIDYLCSNLIPELSEINTGSIFTIY